MLAWSHALKTYYEPCNLHGFTCGGGPCWLHVLDGITKQPDPLPPFPSQMSTRTVGQPQGFALFATAAHARQAVDALAGLPFDYTPVGSSAVSPAPSVIVGTTSGGQIANPLAPKPSVSGTAQPADVSAGGSAAHSAENSVAGSVAGEDGQVCVLFFVMLKKWL